MGFLSKIAKKVKKQIKRSSKQVEKQVKRSAKQVEKQVKRSTEDVVEVTAKVGPYATLAAGVFMPAALPALGAIQMGAGVAGSALGMYDQEEQVINIDPRYNVGGTPMGMGSMARPTPGTEVGGPPNPMTFYWPGTKNPINPLFIWGAGILVLWLAFDGRRR